MGHPVDDIAAFVTDLRERENRCDHVGSQMVKSIVVNPMRTTVPEGSQEAGEEKKVTRKDLVPLPRPLTQAAPEGEQGHPFQCPCPPPCPSLGYAFEFISPSFFSSASSPPALASPGPFSGLVYKNVTVPVYTALKGVRNCSAKSACWDRHLA